jgi:hypothetical protein
LYLCKKIKDFNKKLKDMQALRQIVNITDNSFHFVLPSDFKADKVEVIVLPVLEQNKPSKLKNSERFFGAISEETAQKLHKHLNEVRNEWERDIY